MRRSLASMASLALLSLVVPALVGCSDVFGTRELRQPGELLGVFTLSATVDPRSTCLEIVAQTPNPWTFDVELRRDGNVAYWGLNGNLISGTIDDGGQLVFNTSMTIAARPADKVHELGACVLRRTDSFVANVTSAGDGGTATLQGTLRYLFTVEPGSDCRDLQGSVERTAQSPNFSVVPCEVSFAVRANRK